MSFQYELWKDSYFEENLKDFPCPRCKTGRMSLKKGTFSILEPDYSESAHSHEAFEPEWIEERFIGFLQCNNSHCGELAAISGYVEWDSYIDYEEYGEHWERKLYVKNMYPASPIILLPSEIPKPVKQEIEKSFSLFWNDKEACAGRLRKSVEKLLDDKGIPRIQGKGFFMLDQRIKEFAKTHLEYSDTLDALRLLGNVGTHGDDIKLEAVLDAFYVYEYVLAELYGQRAGKVKELTRKLIESKGKYQ